MVGDSDSVDGRFVTSFLSIYLVSALRLDEGVVGTVVAMYGFGAIIGCLFGGTLSDRFGRQSMIIIGEIGAAGCPTGRFRTH